MSLRRPTLLVVEDDRSIREALCDLLSYEGFDCHQAENGQEALDILQKVDRPAMILLDLMMPVMSGWDFLDELQKHESFKRIPIIMISALDNQKIENHSVVRIFRKPIDVEGLLAEVRRHIQE